tara:strand:+ start:1391 stop:1762 length:372 start_codon:yes stop_codon:yes gene_type:complete
MAFVDLTEIEINDCPKLNICNILMCPECQSSNLHFEDVKVELQEPNVNGGIPEDGLCNVVEVSREKTLNKKANPTFGRRDNIFINFTCEHCDNLKYTLTLHHSKGITYQNWVKKWRCKKNINA